MSKHTASVSTLALGLVVGLGLGGGAISCKSTEPNPEHCWYAEGDATCEAEFGEGYYCAAQGCDGYEQNLGCVQGTPDDNECWSPCGGEQTANEKNETECGGIAEESGSSSSTTDSTTTTTDATTDTMTTTETTGSEPCMMNSECTNPSAPFCEMSVCVGCADAPAEACAELDSSMPVCDEGTNTCVQCLPDAADACTGTTPVCDAATSSCVACQWHEDCPGTACKMSTGECFQDNGDNILTAMDADQFATHISTIANLDPPVGVIFLTSDVQKSVTLSADMIVAILSEEDPEPQWQSEANNNPALIVEAGAEVYVQNVRVYNTAGNMDGWGISSAGNLWIDRCGIVNNDAGGMKITGGSTTIRNSFVGGDISDKSAIDIQGGTATIIFTTIGAGFGAATGLQCADGTGTTVRNSLLVARTQGMDVVDCPNATITNSALDMQAIGDNVVLGDMNTNWFTSYASGDFHLSGMHSASINTAAIWQPGDPLVDIDGDPRPQDQALTVAGADLP